MLCDSVRRLCWCSQSFHWAFRPVDTCAGVHCNLELPQLLYWHNWGLLVLDWQSLHSRLVKVLTARPTRRKASPCTAKRFNHGGSWQEVRWKHWERRDSNSWQVADHWDCRYAGPARRPIQGIRKIPIEVDNRSEPISKHVRWVVAFHRQDSDRIRDGRFRDRVHL